MTPYEVRCPRCDVSFPVETKRCLHCGGPTARADQIAMIETFDTPDDALFEHFPDPIDANPHEAGGELETQEESTSTGRSLLRSFGGFIWVIVLIGFTLARNCGGE